MTDFDFEELDFEVDETDLQSTDATATVEELEKDLPPPVVKIEPPPIEQRAPVAAPKPTPMDESLDDIINSGKIFIPQNLKEKKSFPRKDRQGVKKFLPNLTAIKTEVSSAMDDEILDDDNSRRNVKKEQFIKQEKKIPANLMAIKVGTEFNVAAKDAKPSTSQAIHFDPRALRNIQGIEGGAFGYVAAVQRQLVGPKYNMNIQHELNKIQGKKETLQTMNTPTTVDGVGGIDEKLLAIGTKIRLNTRFA